jgi:hypothetical protein
MSKTNSAPPSIRATEATLKSFMGLSARHASETSALMMSAPRDGVPEEPLDLIAEAIGADGVEVKGDIAAIIAPKGATTVYCRISEGKYYIGPAPEEEAPLEG